MRQANSLTIVFCLFILIACSDSANLNKPAREVSLGTTVQVENGTTVSFTANSVETVEVQVLSIDDSRCPADVTCIWEGNAKVGFQIGTLKNIIYLCILKNISGCPQEIEVLFEDKYYILTLLDVTPYPTTANSEIKKIVKFEFKLK